MAVLEENPPALGPSILKLCFGLLCLALPERNRVETIHHVWVSTELHEGSDGIGTGRKHENEWGHITWVLI